MFFVGTRNHMSQGLGKKAMQDFAHQQSEGERKPNVKLLCCLGPIWDLGFGAGGA